MKREKPSMDRWLREAKALPDAPENGMYLLHNGVVRRSARARVRQGQEDAPPVAGMRFSCDWEQVEAAVARTRAMEGIFHVRVWLNEGLLQVGDDIMYVLVGGDIRPHVAAALDALVTQLKTVCVTEQELYGEEEP